MPSRKNSQVEETTLVTKQTLTEETELKISYLTPGAVEEVQRLLLSSRHFEQPADIFVEPVVILSEEEINSTKLLCAGSNSLCVYSQDQKLHARVMFEEIAELILPTSNLLWVVVRAQGHKDFLLEMARREEFVMRVLVARGDGDIRVITGAANDEIEVDFYDRKKLLSQLPKEINNPLRYISTFSQQSGHLYFKPPGLSSKFA